jgi:hypothetical protein
MPHHRKPHAATAQRGAVAIAVAARSPPLQIPPLHARRCHHAASGEPRRLRASPQSRCSEGGSEETPREGVEKQERRARSEAREGERVRKGVGGSGGVDGKLRGVGR